MKVKTKLLGIISILVVSIIGIGGSSVFMISSIRGTVRKMRIYNAKPISPTIPPVLTTLRKFQGS
ncbi:hypothetical protein D9C11_22550 [Bacillus subtilis subsp. subtilis]|nr:hypothetical protein D9C11_22550 [Bacillus subtilis subsp. subtilis]